MLNPKYLLRGPRRAGTQLQASACLPGSSQGTARQGTQAGQRASDTLLGHLLARCPPSFGFPLSEAKPCFSIGWP